MGRIFGMLFGGGRNVVAETAGVFRENAEAGAQRRAEYGQAALAQFGEEFLVARKGRFDAFMDGLNRLPRPLMVVCTFLLFASAMFDPVWFAARMQGLLLVPEPLWWLAGTIVTFYFGGRIQMKSQEFHKSLTRSTALAPQVTGNIARLEALQPRSSSSPGSADTGTDGTLSLAAVESGENAAVSAWRNSARA
ncbi:holin family protein [Roseobacteraceae bacterium NS-SX3]